MTQDEKAFALLEHHINMPLHQILFYSKIRKEHLTNEHAARIEEAATFLNDIFGILLKVLSKYPEIAQEWDQKCGDKWMEEWEEIKDNSF